jgi:hypothetical protein
VLIKYETWKYLCKFLKNPACIFTLDKMHFTYWEQQLVNSRKSTQQHQLLQALQMLMCIRRVQSLTTHKKPCAHTLFLSANITQASEAKISVPEAKFGLGRRF